jgi:Protein of unknown function (DUF2924)
MKNRCNHPHRSITQTGQISHQIAIMADMTMAELWAIWDQHFSCRPPHPNRRHLESRLAYRLQEQVFGGVPLATKNLLAEIGEQCSKIKTSHHQSNTPLPGTTLVREFDGQQYRVQVLGESRFEINGQLFKSLSAIARMITGTSASGQEFFGLTGEQ